MQVPDATAGDLVYQLAPPFHPAIVAEIAEGNRRDRLVLDLPGAFGCRLVIHGELDFSVQAAAEETVVIVAGLDRLAVYGDQVIPLRDLEPVFIGRPVFVNVRDFVSAALLIGGEVETKMPRHDRRPTACHSVAA